MPSYFRQFAAVGSVSENSGDIIEDSEMTQHLYHDLLENVLLCTVSEVGVESSNGLVYLSELYSTLQSSESVVWNNNILDQALFERLHLPNPSAQLVLPSKTTHGGSSTTSREVIETQCLPYLAACYQRLLRQKDRYKQLLPTIQKLFIDYSKTALTVPDLYEQNLNEQWIGLLLRAQENSLLKDYTDRVMEDLLSDSDAVDSIHVIFETIFKQILKEIQRLDYFSTSLASYVNLLSYLSKWPLIVKILFNFSRPLNPKNGRSWEETTLLGCLLSKSCLPQTGKQYLFFEQPTQLTEADIERTASKMWQLMSLYQNSLSQLFLLFVKNADVRNDVLKWIGDCLLENRNTPFIARDPTTTTKDESYNFITEIFFMTHLCYYISAHRLYQLLMRINQELSQVQQAYNDANQGYGAQHEGVQRLQRTMEQGMTAFFNIKSVLSEPAFLDLSNCFFSSTCSWLVHLACTASPNEYLTNSTTFKSVTKLPLSEYSINEQLSYIPEFILENMTDFLVFIGRFNAHLFDSLQSSINEYVTMILVFMGDASRLRNPHLRASLAEALELLLPKQHANTRVINSVLSTNIFTNHPLIDNLTRVLLDVFVSIELTGQAVQFEQKFNYRRPMYEILEYVWQFEEHRQQVKKLAIYAEEHIEDAEAPLFLRFINLLMNDANYLLDEALSYMARLKENQEARKRGDWSQLSEQQREETENTFRHTGMIARFHNIMGIKTISILAMVTHDIQSIFCHPAICERLAMMLNYFLQHLVGPKRRNLKVNDLLEYQFEPQKLVAKVTDIYLNFGESEAFCIAVGNDGMSYNDQLFPQAVEVLEKIKHPSERISNFLKLGEKIKELSHRRQEEDAQFDDAPDDYLDPITSTLMTDPVMLPSSKQILDRQTIARHLLSDQTDPFNRNYLRMQDVLPQPQLKQEIEQWKQKRSKTKK
ncbi:unnamed protein product [Didymodactylos carnosus]|uniref:Ubiquitin conjugation factor E4 A n=1 Tax=Didymodactylos carnosus TaxID=1234261 RepID=A0A814ES41_9BILA|nr:unnamed protein product [Didymodactylos carnosus]CAF3747991.1 unnamed protein product [Didymodactylos carnosus]